MSERQCCGISEVICLVVFLLFIVAFSSGCELEKWTDGSSTSRKSDSISLDEIERIHLKEYEENCRRPASRDSWDKAGLDRLDKYYEVHLWALNKKCREEVRNK